MGKIVKKSFSQVRKSIIRKSDKLQFFIEDNSDNLNGNWTRKQNATYDKLAALCISLMEEIDNLDEIEVPEFDKCKTWI